MRAHSRDPPRQGGQQLVLAQAGQLAVKAKSTSSFLEKHCKKSDVSEEWKKVDDRKIAKLRGVLKALQEENQSTQLLKKESQDKRAGEALQATRASVDMRLEACKQKEADFIRNEAELRRRVMDNEKALQDLQANIEKGEKRTRDERAECRELDKEIKTRTGQLHEQEQVKAALQKKIGQTSQYRKYLERVVQECEEDFEGDVEVLMSRHGTLEAGNIELHQSNEDLTARLDRAREECLRVQTKLQNEHLMMSSRLHECQVSHEKHRAENQELETRLNRALAVKELKESQVGVIQVAIEQLFERTLSSCRLKQRRKAMKDAPVRGDKYAPVRGDRSEADKSEARLEEMLKQIIERVEDLQDIYDQTREQLGRNQQPILENIEEVDGIGKVRFERRTDIPSGRRGGNETADGSTPTLSGGTSSVKKAASAREVQ